MKPKGKLLIIGGAEHKGDETLDMEVKNIKFRRYELLRELLISKKKSIEIVTTGSHVPHEVRESYENVFKKIGYHSPGFIPIQNKMESDDEEYLQRVKNAAAVFFSGGDQFRISSILGGTSFIDIIKDRYLHDRSFLVAGTSAGAMVLSTIMITGGGLEEALISRDVQIAAGLGFLDGCIVDTHFIKRGRFSRLAHAVIMNPTQLGVGLGEDTALIIKNGYEAECKGSGMVVIIDGSKIKRTNIDEAGPGEPVYVDNLSVDLLVKGCRFSFKTRKLLRGTVRE